MNTNPAHKTALTEEEQKRVSEIEIRHVSDMYLVLSESAVLISPVERDLLTNIIRRLDARVGELERGQALTVPEQRDLINEVDALTRERDALRAVAIVLEDIIQTFEIVDGVIPSDMKIQMHTDGHKALVALAREAPGWRDGS